MKSSSVLATNLPEPMGQGSAASEEVFSRGHVQWRTNGPVTDPEVLRFLENPESFFPPVTEGKARGQSATTPRQTERFFYKRYNHHRNRWSKLAKSLFRKAPAQQAFRLGIALRATGINTPTPIAVGTRRVAGVLVRAYLVTDRIPDAASFMQAGLPERELARRLAAFISRFHQSGFIHGDLSARNLLVTPDGELHLIDLDTARAERPLQNSAAQRELLRFRRSLGTTLKSPVLSCARFLRDYCGARNLDWKDWWKEMAKADKVARERVRG